MTEIAARWNATLLLLLCYVVAFQFWGTKKSFLICRFIGERNRSLCERIFWVVFVAIGVFFSGYFTLGIVQKWQNSPVYMSVGDTSHHVANLPFPAVTICSVNKIEKDRLSKSIKGIEAIQNAQNLTNFNSTMDFEAVIFMIDALINFDKANFSDPYWQWVAKNSPKIRSSDLLKLFRSVSRKLGNGMHLVHGVWKWPKKSPFLAENDLKASNYLTVIQNIISFITKWDNFRHFQTLWQSWKLYWFSYRFFFRACLSVGICCSTALGKARKLIVWGFSKSWLLMMAFAAFSMLTSKEMSWRRWTWRKIYLTIE